MMYSTKIIKQSIVLSALLVIICCSSISESKLFGRSRYYDDPIGYDGPYGMTGATGERAILTVRGTRNPYDGSAPNKLIIEDNPYRGPYPRGVYDRLDAGYGGMSRYPRRDYGYSNYGGYGGLNQG